MWKRTCAWLATWAALLPSEVAGQNHLRASSGPFTTAQTNFVAVPGAQLSVPAPGPGDQWVLFLAATLSNDSTGKRITELRYTVNGAQRGSGGVSADSPTHAAPIVLFDRLQSDAGTLNIGVDLRSAELGYTSTIDHVRLLAVKFTGAADLHFAEAVGDVAVPADAGFQPMLSLTLRPPRNGNYIFLAGGSTSDAPNDCSIGVRVSVDGGATFPVPRQGAPEASAYFVNPRDNGLTFLALRYVSGSGPLTYSLEAVAGPTMSCPLNPATLRNPRMMAFRADSFTRQTTAVSALQSATTTATQLQSRAQVPVGTADAGVRYLLLQNQYVSALFGGLGEVEVGAGIVNPEGSIAMTYGLVDYSTAISFGWFDIVTADGANVRNLWSSVDGGAVEVRDSVVIAMEIPHQAAGGGTAGGSGTGGGGEAAGGGTGGSPGTASLRVGCGCRATSVPGWLAMATLTVGLRRRSRRHAVTVDNQRAATSSSRT